MKIADEIAPLPMTTGYLNPDDPIAAYRNNPLIGALGPISTEVSVRKQLTKRPAYCESERRLPAHLRAHSVCALQSLFIPAPAHLDVSTEIAIMIRQGYVHRNPLSIDYRRQVRKDRPLLKEGVLPPQRYRHVPLLGTSAIGPGGTGKTVAFQMALSEYQQVIEHRYKVDGVGMAATQVVWLKLDLFQDASLKSFGIEFFDKLDEAVGQPISRDWGVAQCNGNNVQPLIYRASREFNLGIIVIDEVQNMSARGQGYTAVLRYFVRMMNCLGLPIAIIGNNMAQTLIKQDLSAARRFIGRIRPFEPFKPGRLWKTFLGEVWNYEYVQVPSQSAKFEELVYELTGGVPDLVIKLFSLAQTRLFGRKREEITGPVLEETAGYLFATIQERIVELKGKKPESAGIQEIRDEVATRFKQATNNECGRVGARPAFVEQPPPRPVELTQATEEEQTDGSETTAACDDELVVAGRATDKKDSLRKLGVLDMAL